MYISELCTLTDHDNRQLESALSHISEGEALVVCSSPTNPGRYAWMSRRGNSRRQGCGDLRKSNVVGGINVASHRVKVFAGNRDVFSEFIKSLAEFGLDEMTNWKRVTYMGDCQEASAQWLDDEQGWCAAAFQHCERPAKRTAFIVSVYGSGNYFGYFNFSPRSEHQNHLKSCWDLNRWSSVYIPRMYSEFGVKNWIFLGRTEYDIFCRSADDYKKSFWLFEYSYFDYANGAAANYSIPSALHEAFKETSEEGGTNGLWKSALGKLGLNRDENWTKSDQLLVDRTSRVLAEKPSGPIDMTKCPVHIAKLKSTIFKRLKLTNVPPHSIDVEHARALFLDLSRFLVGWDKVSCEGLFSGSNGFNLERLANCLTDDMAQPRIDAARKQLAAELGGRGVAS